MEIEWSKVAIKQLITALDLLKKMVSICMLPKLKQVFYPKCKRY